MALLVTALVLLVAGVGPSKDLLAVGSPAPLGGPGFDWRAWSPPSSIELGESIRLRFRLDDLTDSAEDGSISVSFPDLTQSGGDSSSYSSSQGSVRTDSYTSGTSRVKYYDRGDSIWNSRNSQVSARYLLVEPLDPDWPANASRTLELEVTPNETGVFRVFYRFWVCVDSYADCTRAPTGRDVDDTDQQGFDVGEFRIRVEQSNNPPSVSAVSPLQSLTIDVGDSVTFTARATDRDDNISQVDWYVDWSWENGQSLSQTGRIERSYTRRFSSAGTYRVEVEFSDTDGESDSVAWEVFAERSNHPPSVTPVSPLQSLTIDVGDSVTFAARATDQDDNISQVDWYVDWSWENGQSLSQTGRIERSYTRRFSSAGTYRVEVEFSDTDGESDSVAWEVFAERSNHPPSVTPVSPLQSLTIDVGDSVTFAARATDQDDNISQVDWYVDWSWENGQSLSQTGRIERSYTRRFSSAGTYRVEVEFSDTDGESDSVAWEVFAERSNHPPSVTPVSPLQSLTIDVGDSVTFAARATDQDDNISQVDWYVNRSWENGESLSQTGRIERSYTRRFSSAGTYRVEVEFSDTDGESDSVAWEVFAERSNHPPSVTPVSPLQSLTIDVGDSVTFAARATDQDDNISQVDWYVDWSWENGQSLSQTGRTERSYTRRFSSAGTYRIAVEFTDANGESDSVVWELSADDPNRPPSVSAVSPLVSLLVSAGESVTFTARGTDPDNNINQVEWYVNGQWESGQSLPLTGSVERTYRHTFSTGGNYRVEAVFTDDDGASDSVYRDLRAGQPPVVNDLGCSDTSVDIGETVSCSPSIGGGNPTEYLWGSVGGNPWNGTSRTYSTHWDTPGRKQIVFEACNNDGCDDGDHWVEVVPRVDPPPRIDRLDCSSTQVKTGEAVSCQPGISGGSPSRYLWRSNGGTPSSGNSSRFSTHWDSPGNKQISLEVCNDGGCVTSQHTVVVERDIPATLRVSASGEIVPGASIQVSGTGFPSSRSVSFVRIGGRTVQQRVRHSTDGNGQFIAEVTIPLLPPGNHDVVAEAGGKTATTSIRIEAAPLPNRPPMVSPITPLESLQLTVGSTQQFTAEATDPDNDLTKVEWFVNGGMESSEPIRASGTVSKSWSYRVPSSGNYRLTAKFTDAAGLNDSVEWRFEGMTAAQFHPPAPRVDDISCGSLTVSVGELVTCSPTVSGGDGSLYEWSGDGGDPSSGSDATFSTSWATLGQKEIEFETCNRLGSCDSGSQTITVEDVFYIGAQDTYQGELSFTGDHQLLKVFVSAGRRLRLELIEPQGVDFAFNVSLEDFEGEVTRSWSLNSFSRPKSIEIPTPAAGWYKVRIVSKRGQGEYEFNTRTDHAHLYLVVDDFSADHLSHILLFKSNCGSAGGTADNFTIIETNTESKIVRFDLDEADHITRSDCFYDLPEGDYWNLSIVRDIPWWQNLDYRKVWLSEATVDLAYDDVNWRLSSGPERYVGAWFNVCIPSCNPTLPEQAVAKLFRIFFFDDLEVTYVEESTRAERVEGGVWFGSNFIGVGLLVKFGKVVNRVWGPLSSKADDVWRWIRRVDDDAIEPALKSDWQRLGYEAFGEATGETISKLPIPSMDDLLTPSEFAKVRTRLDGVSAGEKWLAIRDRINKAQALTPNEIGFLGELQVAAAAKQLGLSLPNNWLRRPAGRAGRLTTDLDVLARLPSGELIAFESKGSWSNFASSFRPGRNSQRFVSDDKTYELMKMKAHLSLLLLEAKNAGAHSLVIVAKGSPKQNVKEWMVEQGIVFVRLAE